MQSDEHDHDERSGLDPKAVAHLTTIQLLKLAEMLPDCRVKQRLIERALQIDPLRLPDPVWRH